MKYKAGDRFFGYISHEYFDEDLFFEIEVLMVRAHDYICRYKRIKSDSWMEAFISENDIDKYVRNYEVATSPLMQALR